jgi:transposase
MFAELVVESGSAEASRATEATSGVEIVIADVVIRAGSGADEGQLTRAIRAARAATS